MSQKRCCENKPEILAPAGDWTTLTAALDAGCDAVYFGITGMNMRAGAGNFSAAAMPRLVRRCRAAGARAYLALNTIVREQEIARATGLVARAAAAGVDAVICWDFAVIQAAHEAGLPVHVSTQMSLANSAAISVLARHCHVRRLVLARECTLADIRTIRRRLLQSGATVQLEAFAHGALCVSLSGRCFLSQFCYGKSANQGACLQPCRREYYISATDEDLSFRLGPSYLLSPRDLCTLPFIEQLLDAGIAALKIEGRNRSPEYVAAVTRAYRQAVDAWCAGDRGRHFTRSFAALKTELMATLQRVYNRGFSPGFYLGRPLDDWTAASGSNATMRKHYCGRVLKYFRKAGVAEIRVESTGFKTGDELLIQGPATGSLTQQADSIEIDHCKIRHARKGSLVALKTGQPVRKNDKVYVVKPAGASSESGHHQAPAASFDRQTPL